MKRVAYPVSVCICGMALITALAVAFPAAVGSSAFGMSVLAVVALLGMMLL